METSPMFNQIVVLLAAIQTGAVLMVSGMIIVRYSRHRSMVHISLVAVSYMILTALTAGAIIYRIFLEGQSRTVSIVLALIAFALGDFALWKVWHSRNNPREIAALQVCVERIEKNEERLARLEAKLEIMPGTEDDPLVVKVVDGKE